MLLRLLLKRTALGLVTLLMISILIFFATNILPGDAARAILGQSVSEEALAALRAQLGLDQPIANRYLGWIAGLVQGDWGNSMMSKGPVSAIVVPHLKNTLVLLVVAAVVAIPLSILTGALMAMMRGKAADGALNMALIVLAGVPEFVTAILLVLLLSTQVFHLLPPTAMVPSGRSVLDAPQVLVLPVLTLTLAVVPYLGRLVRASLMDALASEYVVMARLKGLSPRIVLWRHALRNSLVPTIQASALTLAWILGGSVVVEYMFQYPGLGTALQTAVATRDILVIQAIVLIFATGYIAFNILADTLTILMTPRLRAQG